MTTINGDIYNSAAQAPQANNNGSLGQADFLKLMTEQLKHQDPLKPMDNKEFLGQMAQFSTVQGINNMQDAMKGLSETLIGDQVLRGATLVGHDVLIPSETIALDQEGNQITGSVAATAPGTVNFEIKDETGKLIKTISVPAEAAGEVEFAWDGTDADGKNLPAGKYSIAATQVNASGDKAELSTYLNAMVESVSIGSDGLYLNLKGLGAAPIGHVLRVS